MGYCIQNKRNERKTVKNFEEWQRDCYWDDRPGEPCDEKENAEQWACIADYAVDNRYSERKKMKTLYLSGAISNNPNYKQDFQKAYKDLTEAGYTVISPLHICREDWDWKAYMRQCIKALVLGSDAVAIISSTFYSRGMELEIHIAKNLDIPVERVEYWINLKGDKNGF